MSLSATDLPKNYVPFVDATYAHKATTLAVGSRVTVVVVQDPAIRPSAAYAPPR